MEESARPRLMAARVLAWLETERPATASAVPVERLAERLGLAVATFHPASQPPGTLGYLEPGEDLILLRDGLPDSTRRFTLAHELGHALLHRALPPAGAPPGLLAPQGAAPAADASCDAVDLAVAFDALGADDELLRGGQSYSARSARESEANAFAAALLLPAGRLLALAVGEPARAAHATRPVLTARALAMRFGVSEEVTLRRLAALLDAGAADAVSPPERDGQEADEDASAARALALDPDQRAAAESATPALVVAGPGTGKTSTLVARVAYLVGARHIPPERILALTFSNRAAREMRARIMALLGPRRGAAPTVATIHAFCGTLLRHYGPLVGLRPDFRVLTEAEGYFELRRIVPGMDLAHYAPLAAPAQYFPDLLAAISRAKDELLDPAGYAALATGMRARATSDEQRAAAERAAEVARVYAAYQAALAIRGDADFGDIVRLAVRLLVEAPEVLAEVRVRYQAVLVDEFQDINRAMGVLLRTLAGPEGPLWAVGDADQAIYRFRGASPANLLRFTEDYPHGSLRHLRYNYRSRPPILAAAAAVAETFLPVKQRVPLVATRAPAPASGATVTLAMAPDEASELAGIAASIERRVAEGRALDDQAILCRTRRQAQRVAESLGAAGIPSRTVAPLLDQDDIRRILAVISLLAERSGMGLLRAGGAADHSIRAAEARAILGAARARDVAPLVLCREGVDGLAGLSAMGARGVAALLRALDGLRTAPDVATGLARYAFSLTGLGRRLLAGVAVGDVAVCEEARHLAQLLALARAFDDARHETGAADGPRRRARWAEFLDYVRVLLVLRQELGGPEQQVASGTGIWVLTAHASKGLEFPVVYLAGVAARRFPTQRRHAPAPLPEGALAPTGADAGESADAAHVAEEACLFYVALTRARDELVLTCAERYGRLRYALSPFVAPIAQRLGDDLARVRWPERAPGPTGAAPAIPAAPAAAGEAAIAATALDTYLRCPRQYAYRYVDGLRAPDAGLSVMRAAVAEALAALAAPDAREPSESSGRTEDALAAYDARWEAAPGAQPPTPACREAATEGSPFREIYRRHGRAIVERAARATSSQGSQPGAPARHDQPVRLRLGEHVIELTLDRVEIATSAAAAHGAITPGSGIGASGSGDAAVPHAGTPTATGHETVPRRFVRQRLGPPDDRPDTRALLYALAAAQASATDGEPAVACQEQLGDGEPRPIQLSARQIERLRGEVEAAAAGIAARQFAPRPDPHTCAACPFLLICPA